MRLAASIVALLASASVGAQQAPDSVLPPPVNREFRAVWIATVRNMDWPSRADLTPGEQRQELLAILDRAAALRMNAVVLQVRPEGDALYVSPYEPWSRYLTGAQGRAPDPLWDPLEFAVGEAHKRGLELHAWFNPYRAAYRRDEPTARTHISKRRPELVVPYGQYLWMDPGFPEVRRLMIRTVLDVVRRYDIDGVHIDDYFYPYPETVRGERLAFPDRRSYAAYRRGGGQLSRNNWRRRNVDLLVREFYEAVKAEKRWVKVGISPFGIWRPGNPPSIRSGIDQVEDLYADARKWLREGWLDYIAPQLYWPVQPPEQSYPVLLQWWVDQSIKGRHVFPGLALFKLASGSRRMSSDDIVQQILITRDTPGAFGHVLFNAKVLMENVDGIGHRLAPLFTEPAVVPAMPWLDRAAPARPIASAVRDSVGGEVLVRFAPQAPDSIASWVIQSRANGTWRTIILPGPERRHILREQAADLVAVSAVDRAGNLSVAALARPR